MRNLDSRITPLSLPFRIGLAIAVVLAAGLIYVGLCRGSSASDYSSTSEVAGTGPRKSLASKGLAGKGGENWYRAHVEEWRALPSVPLMDDAEVFSAVRKMVQGRWPGPTVDEAVLSRCIADALVALSANSANDYVLKVRPLRALRDGTELAADANVQARVEELTGNVIRADSDLAPILELLWRPQEGEVARPSRFSPTRWIQIAESNPRPTSLKPGWSLGAAIDPKYSMGNDPGLDNMRDSFSVGCLWVTKPTTSLERALEVQPTIPICRLYVVMHTTDGDAFPMGLHFFQSPVDRRWHLFIAGCSTPYKLRWIL